MSLRIVFMGTPEFAVSSLDILVEQGYNIVGVVTATDKWGGRGGKKLIESEVKKYAQRTGLRILQPKNLKAPEFVSELKSLQADLQIVVAFRMLPEVVWNMPRLGTINLHGSLLPKYRGAAPIHWAVINGETETGVTTFFLQHEIDTGDILIQDKMPIKDDDNVGKVHDRMMALGAKTVLKSVQMIEKGNYQLLPQDDTAATKAPKLFTHNTEINFNQNTQEVYNFIRGLSPYPAAWTTFLDKKLKIYAATQEITSHNLDTGDYTSDGKSFLKFATKDGFIHCEELQLQGKKRMGVKDFLNGVKV